MPSKKDLPYPVGHDSADDYVESLLKFSTNCDMLQTLCGGVHILDFLTRELDLYSTVLPDEWRCWLGSSDIPDILDLLMREDLQPLMKMYTHNELSLVPEALTSLSTVGSTWRCGTAPPLSLLQYIQEVRNHTLDRSFDKDQGRVPSKSQPLSKQVAVGMKPKKAHEVEEFASFVDGLVSELVTTNSHNITHLIDFGSGQNYLGRVLASLPYEKQVVAIESKQSNIDEAKNMDVSARLAKKERILRNKKVYRLETRGTNSRGKGTHSEKSLSYQNTTESSCYKYKTLCEPVPNSASTTTETRGDLKVQYIQHIIRNGDLSDVVRQIEGVSYKSYDARPEISFDDDESKKGFVSGSSELNLMVVSLHSCGNLVHHGIRSLLLNPAVKAVAMVGCCYNLVTERFYTPISKFPTLRPPNPRLVETSSTCDPHGFPVSERLATYKHGGEEGIRLNITARMMAVQAPHNWTPLDCEAFFTRHFYRALLQKIFLDRGIVAKPAAAGDIAGGNTEVWRESGQPVVIGSLRKACYESFTAYVRGAISKLEKDTAAGSIIGSKMQGLTDEDILGYEKKYESRKKDLSIVWSLMAFSAGVVESLIVVDRWLYLKEQEEVEQCWVETVFEYKRSPRNLVVVGIKKKIDHPGNMTTQSRP